MFAKVEVVASVRNRKSSLDSFDFFQYIVLACHEKRQLRTHLLHKSESHFPTTIIRMVQDQKRVLWARPWTVKVVVKVVGMQLVVDFDATLSLFWAQ